MLTATEALKLAAEHHHAGRLDEAKAVYEAMVAQAPRNPELLRVFAILAEKSGQPETALRYIEGALVLKPADPLLCAFQGSLLTGLGRYADAVRVLVKLRDTAPNDPAVHFALAQAQVGHGQLEVARVSLEQVLFFDAEHAGAHNLLGVVFRSLGSRSAAHASFERAAELRPAWVAPHCNLGSTAQLLGRPLDALAHFERALALDPELVDAMVGRAAALLDTGDAVTALEALAPATVTASVRPEVHNTMGRVLQTLARTDEALAAFQEAIALRGDWAVAHSNMGQLQRRMGQLDASLASCSHAVRLDPSLADAWNNLGVVHAERGDFPAALHAFERAVALVPDHTQAHLSRAQCMLTLGRLDRAIEIYRAALRSGADESMVRSRLVMALQYSPRIRPHRLRAEAQQWAATVPVASARPPLRRVAEDAEDTVLRVGFVSADLRNHPVGQCVEAMTQGAGAGLALHFYVSQLQSDDRTARIRSLAHAWCDIHGWSDAAAADRIRTDRIDVLVDLSGHTAGHRLGIFARRPAPVQLSWLGYFASTGLPAMDFFLGDPVVLPESAEAEFTETLLRLDRPYGCFLPPKLPLAVTPPPCLMREHVTLGCFNNLLKLNPETAEMWADLMMAVPDTHLLLKTPALSVDSVRRRTADLLMDVGIPADRMRLEGATPRLQHLAAYGEVDIALDTWPCSGGITSAEAVWMGVPVVTLQSDRFAGRITPTLLHTLGHPEWVATDRAAWVACVAGLARDRARLTTLRRELRGRFMESSLCDGVGLAKAFERVIRRALQTIPS